jgi:hypothetical protein
MQVVSGRAVLATDISCKGYIYFCLRGFHLSLPDQPIFQNRIRPLGLVVKRITSIACYDKIASSILAEGILFLFFTRSRK